MKGHLQRCDNVPKQKGTGGHFLHAPHRQPSQRLRLESACRQDTMDGGCRQHGAVRKHQTRDRGQARSKASQPFAYDTAESPEASAPRQSGMQRFLPLNDTPMTNKDQDSFEMALLKGTISANLPFTWIDNEFIQEAFAIAEFFEERCTRAVSISSALDGHCCELCWL
ncbi:TPA: hypothetical protein ACH3X2_006452 [Trebouxia sp. C0005]